MKVFLTDNYIQVKEKVADIVYSHGRDIDDSVIVFCEEKFTMALEGAIADRCGGGFNHEVSSFNLFLRKNSDRRDVLTRQSSSVVIRKIINDNADRLECFNAKNKPTLPVTVYELIAQLKSAKVKPDDIYSATGNLKGALKSKLTDIAIIFKEYEKYLDDNGYLDTNNNFSSLPEIILKSKKITNSTVIFAGFPSVTGQIADVISAVMHSAKETVFVLVAGDNKDLYLNETLSFLESTGQRLEVEKCNYGINPTAEKIRDNIFCPSIKSVKNGSENIKIYCASSLSDEIKQTALRITYEVKKSKMRYRDFTVAVGDLSNYKLLVGKYFKDYGIPYFIDESVKLSSHPVIKLIKNCFSAYLWNFDISKVLSVVTDELFCPDRDIADRFLRYIMHYAISRRTIREKFCGNEEKIDEIEGLRSAFISIFDGLKKQDEVKNYIAFVRGIIKISHAEQNLSLISEKLIDMGENVKQSFNEQAIEKLDTMLAEIESLAGNDKVDIREFYDLFMSGAEACTVSVLPQYFDCVYVGDFSSVKYKGEKYLFALGLNGDVPHVKADTAILTDNDLSKLDSLSVVIEPKIRIVNRREREAVGLALTSFYDKLFISYSAINSAGKPDVSGDVYKNLCEIFSLSARDIAGKAFFSKGELDADGDKIAELDYIALRPGIMNFMAESSDFASKAVNENKDSSAFYKAMEKLDSSADLDSRLKGLDLSISENLGRVANATDLYFTGGQVSVTTLEDYFSCPYKCFLKHGLKVKEDDDGSVKVTEYGTFLHAVLEEFVKILKKSPDSITEENLEEEVGKIFDAEAGKPDYARYLNKKQFVYAFSMLKEEAINVCREVFSSYKSSSFLPYGTEVKFGDGEKFPAIKLKSKQREYKVRGIVDRADVCGDYIRIVDYKSGKLEEGSKSFYDESLLYAGKKLQLYLYMNAFVDGTGYRPAGMYYCAVNNNYREEDSTDYHTKLMGKTLFSEDVACKSDNTLDENHSSSDIINLKYSYTKKDGKKLSGKDMLSEEDMQSYLKYAKILSEKAIDKINEGYILPTPYGESCKYCKFKGVCGYDEGVSQRQRTVDANGEIIINAVKEEENE